MAILVFSWRFTRMKLKAPSVSCTDELVSEVWYVSKFASALGIKRRTGQISATEGQTAWVQFERMCANDLQLLPIEPGTFHRAEVLTLDVPNGLRAGDALHLAAPLDIKTKSMSTISTPRSWPCWDSTTRSLPIATTGAISASRTISGLWRRTLSRKPPACGGNDE